MTNDFAMEKEQTDTLKMFRVIQLSGYPLPPPGYAVPEMDPATAARVAEVRAICSLPAGLTRDDAEAAFVSRHISPALVALDNSNPKWQENWKRQGLRSALEATQYFTFAALALWRPEAPADFGGDMKLEPVFEGNDAEAMNWLWDARQKADEAGEGYLSYLSEPGNFERCELSL